MELAPPPKTFPQLRLIPSVNAAHQSFYIKMRLTNGDFIFEPLGAGDIRFERGKETRECRE